MIDQLHLLREEASYYCKACPLAERADPAKVRCQHEDVLVQGESKTIVYSSGKCPKGSWDHSHVEPIKQDRNASSTKRIEETVDLPQPIPREQWPVSLEPFIAQRIAGEKGAGDTLKRLAESGDASALQLLVELTKPCSCWARRMKANRLYAYSENK